MPIAQLPPHRLVRDFLGAEVARELLEAVTEQREIMKSSTVLDWTSGTSRYDPGARKSLTSRDLGEFGQLLRARIAETVPAMRQELGLAEFELDHVELELAAHGHGGHFDHHTDTVHEGQTGRIMSAVYYFFAEPRRFSGGELRLFGWWRGDTSGSHQPPHRYITPENDSLLVFPSWAMHEVMPVNCPSEEFADSRFSINCWIWRKLPAEM
jgi:SM-20-related protein